MPDRTLPERVAALEALYPQLHSDTKEIKADVKTLVGAYQRQKGMALIGHLIFSAVTAVVSTIATLWATGRSH